jgi:hypothetical protein
MHMSIILLMYSPLVEEIRRIRTHLEILLAGVLVGGVVGAAAA